jgi:hypothetical protein
VTGIFIMGPHYNMPVLSELRAESRRLSPCTAPVTFGFVSALLTRYVPCMMASAITKPPARSLTE